MPDPRPIAIVTGGARGIGLGVSRALAADGWDLAIGGVRPQSDAADAIAAITAHGGRVLYVQGDISDADSRQRLLSETVDTFGVPAALVNNAGRAPRVRADLLDATEDSFEEVVRTNLQGPYFLTQAVARAMIGAGMPKGGRGGIVFITSVSSEMASPNRGEYCVSKAGLAMAAQVVRHATGGQRHPGLRRSPRHHRHRHDLRREGRLRSTHRRRPDPRRAMGHARRCGARSGGAAARRRALRDRRRDSHRWWAFDSASLRPNRRLGGQENQSLLATKDQALQPLGTPHRVDDPEHVRTSTSANGRTREVR